MRSFFVFVWYELCKSLRQQKVEARCKIRATFLHFISKPDGPSRLISSSLHCFGYHLCYLHHETSRSRECLFLFASRDSLWSRFNLEAVGRRKRTDPPLGRPASGPHFYRITYCLNSYPSASLLCAITQLQLLPMISNHHQHRLFADT